MPRGNIFKVEKLTLGYNGRYFILKKNDNPSGTNYDVRGAYNLLTNIEKEMRKSKHEEGYNLKELCVSLEVRALIDKYKEKLRQTKHKLETLAEKD